MRNSSQILLIALAVVFAVALSLTVALICLGTEQKRSEDENSAPERTRALLPGATLPLLTDDTTAAVTLTSEPYNGMRFRALGNGTCVLESAGDCREAFVVIPEYAPSGDAVVGIAARAFYGCAGIAAIQIPASVATIGELAFADCPDLVYISVSESNLHFCDVEGVLYTADGATLLLYPARHAGSTVTIPATVRHIADMAFYSCTYLQEIRFTGAPAQWEEIRIGSKNYSLTAASVVFYAVAYNR